MLDDNDTVNILGVHIHDVTAQDTLAHIVRFIAAGRPRQLVTVNPEFVMEARRDETFRRVLNGADLALPDGVGILWAARMLGRPLRERVAGSDMVPQIAAQAAEQGHRLYLLGAAPGVAAAAARRLQRATPGLTVAGTWAGSPAETEAPDIIRRIHEARPHVLLVAYGAPQQDLWIARHLRELEVPVVMGVGGAFDFIAGVTRRAPRWMQDGGLEWLHRLGYQPWRWRRMLALPQFALLVLASRMRAR
ncbi:MAG: WecB/TagA/CpsF family glycosyltransferase [Chloroflexi bacterium]|nr:WecB/TagA/CpsF family glycosyltransferase [Chloroflexota bacterium]